MNAYLYAMKSIFLLLFCLSILSASAQDMEVLQKFDSSRADILDVFLYIEDQIAIEKLTHVALIQASDNRKGLENLYTFARNRASELGANCYRITEFDYKENVLRIILDFYYADSLMKKSIFQHQPTNTVYVFGSDSPDKIVSCKVNNMRLELPPFTYYKKENTRGQEIKVSKGGMTGQAVWVTWAQNKPARYITLSGFGISNVSMGGGVGVGFNTGRISYIDVDFGRFLSVVMKPVVSASGR